MKIDIHTHILPINLPKFNNKFKNEKYLSIESSKNNKTFMIKDSKIFRIIEQSCWDINTILSDMNNNNIQINVLSTVPIMLNDWSPPLECLEISKFLRDHVGNKCKENSGRCVGLGTLPMQNSK